MSFLHTLGQLAAPVALGALLLCSCAREREVTIKVVASTDVEGHYFPYDCVKGTPRIGSLSHISGFLRQQCGDYGKEHIVYLDNGDLLYGTPDADYMNGDTDGKHAVAQMLGYMNCAAATLGENDIATGRAVYSRYANDCDFPVVCANIVDEKTGEPWLKPYTVIKRDGVKIAILGMTTPVAQDELPAELWSGLRFENIDSCAARWVKVIKEKEQPHLIIGLFHSGLNQGRTNRSYKENAVQSVARNVPGIDAIVYGHECKRRVNRITNSATGDTVITSVPSAGGVSVSSLEFVLTVKGSQLLHKEVKSTRPASMAAIKADSLFVEHFAPLMQSVKNYAGEKVALCSQRLNTRDALFGPSPIVDLVHTVQLKATNAAVSLASPQNYSVTVRAGNFTVGDLYKIYPRNYTLCTMSMSGSEIKKLLEAAAADWCNTVTSPKDHLLRLTPRGGNRMVLAGDYTRFVSAAGIRYEVDASKPAGDRIKILGMADGTKFSPDALYAVAMSSFMAAGGDGMLTQGAGIGRNELKERRLDVWPKSIRQMIGDYIKAQGKLTAEPLDHWKFVPEKWTIKAGAADRKQLFGISR